MKRDMSLRQCPTGTHPANVEFEIPLCAEGEVI